MNKWNKEKIIKELKKEAKRLGHSPRTKDVHPKLVWECQQNFVSWDNAKKVACLELNKKGNILKEDSKKLSNDLAYVLGVVAGDGYAGYYRSDHGTRGIISLGVTDKDFAEAFKMNLDRWSGHKSKLQKTSRDYLVTLNSVDIAKFIKSFDLKEILFSNREMKALFLRGLFDSDGGVIGKNLDYRRNAKRWIHFFNNNKKIISLVMSILNEFCIDYSINSRVHSGFGSKKLQCEIKIYGLKNIFKYYRLIGFNIERKQKTLIGIIRSYEWDYKNKIFGSEVMINGYETKQKERT